MLNATTRQSSSTTLTQTPPTKRPRSSDENLSFVAAPPTADDVRRRYDRATVPALPCSVHGDSEEIWLFLHAKVEKGV